MISIHDIAFANSKWELSDSFYAYFDIKHCIYAAMCCIIREPVGEQLTNNLGCRSGTKTEMTFRQCCVNFVAMSLPNNGDQHWDNIQTMLVPNILVMSVSNIGATLVPNVVLVILGAKLPLHKNLNFKHICDTNKHLYIGTLASTNIPE